MNFDIILEELKKLLNDNHSINWQQINVKLNQLSRWIGNDQQKQDEYNKIKTDIEQKRKVAFDEQYEQLQQDMFWLQNTEFDQRLSELQELGGFNVQQRLDELRRQRENYKKADDFIKKARRSLDNFYSQIKNDMDKEEAFNQYLVPIKAQGEQLLQEVGEHNELNNIMAQLRQAQKIIEEGKALSTLATLGQFDEILARIEAKPNHEEIELINSSGAIVGKKQKLDALDWYIERAKEYEEQKADEYMAKARQELNDGYPVSANLIMENVQNLKRLSDAKKEKARQFIAEHITPIMERVKKARYNLNAVRTANSLRASIRLFDEALDERIGWPPFDTIAQEKKRANQFMKTEDDTNTDEHSLVGKALAYIYQVMETEFQQWQAQEADLAVGHRLYYTVTQQQIDDLRFFINWRDKRFIQDYGGVILRLIERYNSQAKQVHDLNDSIERAASAFNRGNYTQTYQLLMPYSELLSLEKERYSTGYDLWIRVQPFIDIEKVRQELNAVLVQGILNPSSLQQDLLRLQHARDKGNSIVDQNPDKAMMIGLIKVVRNVNGLYNLVRGLFEQQNDKPAIAKTYIDQAIQDFSHEYAEYIQYAKGVQEQLNASIKNDQDLNIALIEAKRELDQGNIHKAYDLLLPHQDKVNSSHYPEYLEMMHTIRPKLSQILYEQILELLKNPQKALQIETLSMLLEQVDKPCYDTLKEQIMQVVAIQKAYKQTDIAYNRLTTAAWRSAVDAWQSVDDGKYQYEYLQALENYILTYVKEELGKVLQANPERLDEARQRLYHVLTEIEKLVENHHDQQVPILRLRVYAHLLILEDNLQSLHHTIQRAKDEESLCSDDYRQTTEYNHAQSLIQRAHQLYKAASDLVVIFTPQYSLSQWHTTNNVWANTLYQADQPVFIGMRVWEEKFFQNILADLQNQLDSSVLIWQGIEPTAKIILIMGNVNTQQLHDFYRSLQSDLNKVLPNYKGDYVPQPFDELTYLEQLARALQSLRDIVELSSISNIANIADLDATISILTHKREEVQAVHTAVQFGLQQLGAAYVSGAFDMVTQAVSLIIQPDGTYYAYHQHVAVLHLLDELNIVRQEHERLSLLAQEAVMYAQREEFHEALNKIYLLQKADIRFLAVQMVRYTDPFGKGEVITNADDMCDLIDEKQTMIEVLLKWLEPIISRQYILSIIRPDPDQLPVEPPRVSFMYTNIIDFDTLQMERVEFHRANRRYEDARKELEQLVLGFINHTNDPATYYGQFLSLRQAQDILRNVPVKHEQLNSATAVALFNWGVKLFNLLRDYLIYCEKLYENLNESEKQFDYEYNRFRDSYSQLQQNTRDYRRHLDILHESYRRIRGDGSGILPPNGRENDLYPLAHLWTGLDDDYRNYRNRR